MFNWDYFPLPLYKSSWPSRIFRVVLGTWIYPLPWMPTSWIKVPSCSTSICLSSIGFWVASNQIWVLLELQHLLWLNGKEPACQAWDEDSIPGSGRSPGEGNGNPLQYSCLGNPTDRGAWWAAIHGVAKSRTWLKQLNIHALIHLDIPIITISYKCWDNYVYILPKKKIQSLFFLTLQI